MFLALMLSAGSRVEVADFVSAKHPAMVALTPDDWRELMPTEAFTLRASRIGVRISEDDLFAGLR